MSDTEYQHILPARIGRYFVEQMLGEGAMGMVYRARDPNIDRTVAIKVIRDAGAGPDLRRQFSERFKLEAIAAGRLNHPNIVTVHDFGRDDGLYYLVMEYVEGPSLAEAMAKEGEWSVDRILAVIQQILAALSHAHSENVIHRDVKPDNVMCAANGNWKLTDFGIARLDNVRLTGHGMAVGTPSYMAPEQIQGKTPTAATDVYAVGVILYELLAGERPFTGNTSSLSMKIQHQTPVRPSLLNVGVPGWLDDIVAKAMAKMPAERFQTAEEFAAALRRGDMPGVVNAPLGDGGHAKGSNGVGTPASIGLQRFFGWRSALAAVLAVILLAGLGYGAGLELMGAKPPNPLPPIVDDSDEAAALPLPRPPENEHSRSPETPVDDQHQSSDSPASDDSPNLGPGLPADDTVHGSEQPRENGGGGGAGDSDLAENNDPGALPVREVPENGNDVGDNLSNAFVETPAPEASPEPSPDPDSPQRESERDLNETEAIRREAARRERVAFDQAVAQGAAEIREFIGETADRDLAREAERMLERLEREAFNAAMPFGSLEAMTAFLEEFPGTDRAVQVERTRGALLGEPRFRRQERLRLQRALRALGHRPGTIDGIFGINTRHAIRRYQSAQGAASTGYLTEAQAEALQIAVPEPEPIPALTVPADDALPRAEQSADSEENSQEVRDELTACPDPEVRRMELSLNITTRGPTIPSARQDCQSDLEAEIRDCLDRGGEIVPDRPVCECYSQGFEPAECKTPRRPFYCEYELAVQCPNP